MGSLGKGKWVGAGIFLLVAAILALIAWRSEARSFEAVSATAGAVFSALIAVAFALDVVQSGTVVDLPQHWVFGIEAPFTDAAALVADMAKRQATRTGSRWIEPGHILLALLTWEDELGEIITARRLPRQRVLERLADRRMVLGERGPLSGPSPRSLAIVRFAIEDAIRRGAERTDAVDIARAWLSTAKKSGCDRFLAALGTDPAAALRRLALHRPVARPQAEDRRAIDTFSDEALAILSAAWSAVANTDATVLDAPHLLAGLVLGEAPIGRTIVRGLRPSEKRVEAALRECPRAEAVESRMSKAALAILRVAAARATADGATKVDGVHIARAVVLTARAAGCGPLLEALGIDPDAVLARIDGGE